MRIALIAILVTALLGQSGCSIGRVDYFASSKDGWAIAFQETGRPVCLADRQGIVPVGEAEAGRFAISPDGKFVLADSGGKLTLYDRSNDRHYSIPSPDPEIQKHYSVHFEKGPMLTIEGDSRSPVGHKLLIWSPGTGWEETSVRPTGKGVSPKATVHQYDGPFNRDDSLVDFPPSPWIARHVVWVRPDGSVQELLRQNDELPKFFLKVLETPICIFCAPVLLWAGFDYEYKARDQTGANLILDRLKSSRQSLPTSAPESAIRAQKR